MSMDRDAVVRRLRGMEGLLRDTQARANCLTDKDRRQVELIAANLAQLVKKIEKGPGIYGR